MKVVVVGCLVEEALLLETKCSGCYYLYNLLWVLYDTPVAQAGPQLFIRSP